jgi:ribonuclease III
MPTGLEGRLGHRFGNRRLLEQALTHRSYGLQHNERLEFLGDSVLNCVIAKLLYERFASLPEGELSRVRANLVNQSSLFEVASRLEIGSDVLLGEGELKSGGFRRPSILADALEALFGAVFLDAGFDAAERVIAQLFEPILAATDPTAVVKDPKTRLQELLQGRRMALPQYSVVSIKGEAHEQLFRVECAIPELDIQSFGEGPSRRAAEQAAAKTAYELAAERQG